MRGPRRPEPVSAAPARNRPMRTSRTMRTTSRTRRAKIAAGLTSLAAVLLIAGGFVQPPRPATSADPQKEQRLRWFREAKYGLFIHWGLYAIPAGQWQGKRTLGLGEWIMFRAPVPVRQYETLTSQF